MPAMTSLGIGSGLDINSMVSQLVALEGRPLEQMKSQASQLQTQVSSFGKLTSLFSSLQSAANKLTSNSIWSQSVAASSDTTSVSSRSAPAPRTFDFSSVSYARHNFSAVH